MENPWKIWQMRPNDNYNLARTSKSGVVDLRWIVTFTDEVEAVLAPGKLLPTSTKVAMKHCINSFDCQRFTCFKFKCLPAASGKFPEPLPNTRVKYSNSCHLGHLSHVQLNNACAQCAQYSIS